MVDLHIFVTVVCIWGIAVITPGPNFFITAHTAVGESRRLSLFSVLGIVVGTSIWAICGFWGIAVLFNTVPLLYAMLKFFGGLYLIYLGISLFFKTNKEPIVSRRKGSLTALRCFRLGILTNLLNPKTAIFMTSLFAAVISPESTRETGLFCVVLICFISAFWYALVSIFFSSSMVQKVYIHSQKGIKRIAGCVFIIYGVKLVTTK